MRQILDTTYTVADYLRTLNILFVAMFMGLMSFSIIFTIFNLQGLLPKVQFFDSMGLYIAPVVFVIFYLLSTKIYQKKINKVAKDAPLLQKADVFRSVQIFRMSLFEVSVFFSIVGFGLSGQFLYLGIMILGIIIVLNWRPTILKMIKDMELNNTEAAIMQDHNSILYQEEDQEDQEEQVAKP